MKEIMISLAIVFFFVTIHCTQGLQIVPPYPPLYIVIEGEPLTIPCVAGDPNKYPTKVTFKRKSSDGLTFDEINTNKTAYITNSTWHDTKKGLFIKAATLHIEKARYPEDGSHQGKSYKCWSSLDGSKDDFGFIVYVIQKSSLPRGFVQGTATAEFGGTANLTCNVTYSGNKDVQLKKVMWVKNSTVISQGSVNVRPIVITKATTRDGGKYVCAAEVSFKSAKDRVITLDSTILNVNLKMVDGVTQITANISDTVMMECPAEGYPLNVTWFKVNKNGQEVRLNEVSSLKDRAVLSRPCSYCRYRVTIKDLQPGDQAHYVCRGNTNTESARYHSDLYVREGPDKSYVVTTEKPTTTMTTEKELVPAEPSKSNLVPLAIYITLGLLLGLSLIIHGFLVYKLLKCRKKKDLAVETKEKPEKIEIIVTCEGTEKKSSQVELQPLVESTTDQPTTETEDTKGVTEASGTTTLKDDQGVENEKDAKESETEGKCSSECGGLKQEKDQTKYVELPQNEENDKAPARPNAEGCLLM